MHFSEPNSEALPITTPASSHNVSATSMRHHRNLLRAWIYSACGFLIIAPVVSIMLGLHLHARDFQYIPDISVPKFNGRTVLMEVVLINADPLAGTITMDWTVIGEEQSECTASNLDPCSDINIFFDNNLLSSNGDQSALRTSDRPSQPLFRFNSSAFALQDIIANTPTFRTDLALFSVGNHESSLIYYPFDQYSAEIFIFAQDTRTDDTMGMRLARTRGIAVGFKTMASTRPNVLVPTGMVDIVVRLQRGNLVKAFSVVTVIAIWLITLILLLVMLTCVFFGFRQKSEVLVIPVATLFAFTQLRQSMPGAPAGFGDILDFVGLLPCLALLSLSAALTLGAFIFSDPTAKPQILSWDLLFDAFPGLLRFAGSPRQDRKEGEDGG